MSTYQGPHVAVTQKFELSPPAVAIESLPSVVVGTAFDVYEKESLGEAPGLVSGTAATSAMSWASDKVVFDHTVAGRRAFEFYPPKAYVRTSVEDFEIESEDIVLNANGIVLDASDTYPLTTVAEGSSDAFVPYYKATAAAVISESDLQTVTIANGAVVTAKIQKGQKVFVDTTLVGVVGQAPTSEGVIKLAAPYSVAITGAAITIGVTDTTTDLPDTFFDPNADFTADQVQVGDILELNTNDLGEEVLATVTSIINKSTLRLYTKTAVSNLLLKMKSMDDVVSTISGTFGVGSYKVTRLIAFGQTRYEAATGLPVADKVDDTKFKIADSGFSAHVAATGLSGYPEVGFLFTISPDGGQVAAHTKSYTITSLFNDGTDWVIGTDQPIYLDDETTIFTGGSAERFNMWDSVISNEIVADFRAINSNELGVVKRITSDSDITNAWSKDDDISVYNELAWMAATTRSAAGGKVMYGVNVDASEDNLAAQYVEAFEALKIHDVYSHAIGTTDAGVNAVVAAYLGEQSDPYQGHERIASICYDQDNVYAQGSDIGNMDTDGVVEVSGAFNPITAGVTVEDKVDIFDEDGVYMSTVDVVSTPDPDPDAHLYISTDYSGDALNGHTFKFKTGRKGEQANKIAAIKYGDRRVKVIWPGYFTASVGGDVLTLPPYYITANIAGRDGRIIVSQSYTNMTFTPYGLSNLIMNTNFHFKKGELDTIGGGGIDIIIQNASLTQSVKSRHDLTSNMDAIEYREWSITKQADVSAKTYRAAVAPYVGKFNITDKLLTFISTVVGIVSQKLTKSPGIVAKAETTAIKRDEVIVDKINIYVTITVFVAGNYYDIELLVKSK